MGFVVGFGVGMVCMGLYASARIRKLFARRRALRFIRPITDYSKHR